MNVFEILDNVKNYTKDDFKIGFVGNGESFLEFPKLKSYITYVENYPNIHIYTITNGTIDLNDDDWMFLEEHKINVGFSLDGPKELHNKYRCGSYDQVIKTVEHYKMVTNHYPTFNSTVSQESIVNFADVIDFFKQFDSRITFSRMIGEGGITLDDYHSFIEKARLVLNVRIGDKDCTMYGGQCGAGINNYFFSNGFVYFCGNCIDLPPVGPSNIPFEQLENCNMIFDRNKCYKELICE